MRRWLISAATLALAVTLVGQPLAQEPGITGEVTEQGYLVRDFAPEKPASPTLYDDAIPRVYVRFDDGRAVQFTENQIQAFLRRGIPVTLNLNTNTVGTSSSWVTWENVRTLQEFARSHGTTLHIGQHTNGNFETPFLLTHDEIVAELNTDTIFRETGYRPRVLVIPGDAGRREFFKRNRDYMVSVADSLGLWYTDINGGVEQSTGDTLSYATVNPTQITADTYASQRSNFKTATHYQRPGMGIPRWELVSTTFDLGNKVVERVASDLAENFELTTSMDLGSRGLRYGYEFETGVKPPITNEWTITGNGGAANATGLYRRTWANFYTTGLAMNKGFAVVLHDSAGSFAGDPMTGISNAEYVAGAVSPDHIAWTLAMLEKKGHIKCVGIEEYAEWVTGDYAEDTDLIANPRCLIPQFDIGDTLGATSEYPYIRGLGSVNVNNSNQTNSMGQVINLELENTGNVAKYVRRVGATTADNPYYAIGDSVSGSRGRKGGILLRADAANSAPERLMLGFGDLKPGGKYRFTIDIKTASGVNPNIEEFHQAWMGKFYKLTASAVVGFAPAHRDTLISWQWRDQTDVLNLGAFYDTKWNTMEVPLYFPDNLLGETVAGANYGSTSEATGTRLFKPYADGAGAASEGLLIDGKWMWTMQLAGGGVVTLSNPRLIYLGQQ